MAPATPRGSVSDNEYRLLWVAMKSYLEMQLHGLSGRTDAKQSISYFLEMTALLRYGEFFAQVKEMCAVHCESNTFLAS